MKPSLTDLLLCSFLLSSTLICLDKNSSEKSSSNKQDNSFLEKEDQKLLLIFSSIVTCFANILKDPHNPHILALNLGGIATGVINMLLNTLECKTNPEVKKHVKQLQIMTRTFKPEATDQEIE